MNDQQCFNVLVWGLVIRGLCLDEVPVALRESRRCKAEPDFGPQTPRNRLGLTWDLGRDAGFEAAWR